jgi:hypothetical protein
MRTATKIALGSFALLTILAAVSRRFGDDTTEAEVEVQDEVGSEATP